MLESMEGLRRNTDAAIPHTDKPEAVRQILKEKGKKKAAPSEIPGVQLSMFQLDDPVLKQIRDEIKGLDIDSLTPIEALNKLNEIKKITGL